MQAFHARVWRAAMLGTIMSAASGGLNACAVAGPPVEYTVALPAPQTQMIEMAMRVGAIDGRTLDVSLPVWRPGRYGVLDPAQTVREVRATDGAGNPLAVEKITKSTWRVATDGAREVTLRYRVYANSIGDRTRHVDDSHAFLSPSAVFMYVPDRRGDPVHVRVDAPEGWRIASGLEQGPGGPGTVVAPNYDVLVDSPLEVGRHDVLHFDVDGVPHEIVLWPPGLDYDGARLINDFGAIVRLQTGLFGGVPYDRYVFLLHVGAGRGGTEHLNSTIMQTSRAAIEGSLDDESRAYTGLLGLTAHEFFHTWNVKQMRPSGIHPYDYQEENYTKLLWVAEGTTSYYDDLTLVRTGLIETKSYLDRIRGAFAALRDRPGARVQSLESSSFDAWIKFTKRSPDDVNSTISFYSKGALVSLLLDLEIRRRSGGARSLDDVMRAVFERFPLSGPGYTPDDFQRVAEEFAGGSLASYFERFVRGTEALPLEEAMAVVGMELVFVGAGSEDEDEDEDADGDGDGDGDEHEDGGEHEDEGEGEVAQRAYLGVRLSDGDAGASVTSVYSDGPAYAAGLIVGDQVVALDGRRLRAGALDDRLKRYEPGDEVEILFSRRDEMHTLRVTLDGRPDGTWKLRRVKDPTDAQKAAYESWLAQPWPEKKR